MKEWLLVAFVTVSALSYRATLAQEANAPAAGLVGSWTLVTAERIDGPTPVPTPQPRGLTIFDAAGHTIEIITRAGRKPYAANRLTPAEALEAFNTFGGFWGSYRLDEKDKLITYRPAGAVNPSLIGQDLARIYDLSGDRLVITSRPGESNLQGTMRWTWRRVPPIANLDPTYRKLLGFWQWTGERVVATATGETIRAGERNSSVIVYAPSGLIGVHFLPAGRKRLAGPVATGEEAQAAIAGYVGYTAVLTLHAGRVVHHQLFTINPEGG
jgi:Lipocalin-like domain